MDLPIDTAEIISRLVNGKTLIRFSLKKELFSVFYRYDIEPFVPAFSIDTVFYILNSSMKIDKQIARNAIQKLLKFTTLLHSTDEAIHRAFNVNFSDFEDGLINSLAETNNMDAIITNNISDFSASSLPVFRLDDFIAHIRQSSI